MVEEGLTFDDILLIPQYSIVESRDDIDISTSVTPKFKVKIPIIAANMDTVTEYAMASIMAELGGMGIVHRFDQDYNKQADIVRCLVDLGITPAAAIGVNSVKSGRMNALLDAGAQIICIDVAHADNVLVYRVLGEIFNKWGTNKPFDLIVGNIATKGATRRLLDDYGDIIDALKVGVGPGSVCSTRVVTGHGLPQVTAIQEVKAAISFIVGGNRCKLIADGGIRNSGDIVKAIAVGADSVMIGGLIAGCDETPGGVITVNEKRCKIYRGMASYDAMVDLKKNGRAAEGFSALVPCQGSAKPIIEELIGGIQSGFSYTGAMSVPAFRDRARYMRVTTAAVAESHPHLFNKIKN